MTADFQSALHPAGPQSDQIALVWWILLAVSTAVMVGVPGMLAAAIRRRRVSNGQSSERRLARAVGLAVGITSVVLAGLFAASLAVGKRINSYRDPNGLKIAVTGNQWWWEVRYRTTSPNEGFTTANEIHLPVGRGAHIELRSNDVIHSFWVPNLHGKMDAIPGRVNTVWLKADRPGEFRGQCAEFCGLQHAHMALWVVVEPPDAFEHWRRGQIEPSHEPAPGSDEERGREAFLSLPCGLCHAVRGTAAFGQVAPDLTHLATRRAVAAGALPNTRGHLGGWIVDSQRIKPGNRMPPMAVPAASLPVLLTYLESLK
ncbi:MAG: cytochrome c oxidase subunit II [Bryobacteraceae bacterium]|nr:cytochrome c oxidase subunit II [Bryobacteraceae bacterium]